MTKHLFFCFLLFICSLPVFAQQDQIKIYTSVHSNRLRISLITCGMGNEEWQTFGHTTLRVIDSERQGPYGDAVYNYGTFDNFDGDFEYLFLKGNLTYFLQVVPYEGFIQEYIQTGRGVTEQELLMTTLQKQALVAKLEDNALLKNRYYPYDVFYNNCCTKVRDLMASSFGPGFVYGPAFPANIRVSLRTAYSEYYRERHWERVGLNTVIGSPSDTIISNTSIMFIPDFLSKCAGTATVNGKKAFGPKIVMLQDHITETPVVNAPFILTCVLCILTIAGLSLKRLRILGKVMTVVILAISGIFGCLMLFFWFFTNYTCCAYNFNLLWAIPFNLLLPFINFKAKGKYALAGMYLIFVPLVLNVLKVQVLPLFELAPYLLTLLCVYGSIYKQSKIVVPQPVLVFKGGKKAK